MQFIDQLFVKGYVFSSFPKNSGKDIGKRVVNKVKNFLIMLRNLEQMELKLLSKE